MLTPEQKQAILGTYYLGQTSMLSEELDQELIHGRNLYTFTPDGSEEDVLIFFE